MKRQKQNDSKKKAPVINRETLRVLSDPSALDGVRGGMAAAYTQEGHQCDTTICDPPN
jgi:hypothetical protein